MGPIARKLLWGYLKDQALTAAEFVRLSYEAGLLPIGEPPARWGRYGLALLQWVVFHGVPTEDDVRDALK